MSERSVRETPILEKVDGIGFVEQVAENDFLFHFASAAF